MEQTFQLLVAVGGVLLVGTLLRGILRGIRHEIVVVEGEHALLFHRGKLVRPLEPGAWVFWGRHYDVRRATAALQLHAISNQEVPTSDGLPARLSVFVSFRIADPVRALLEHESWQQAMHAVGQVALREVVTGTSADEMLAARGTLGTQIAERVRPRFAELGLQLEGSVDVRDITFPGDLKRAFAKVLLARKEGEAALERARGEQAALRSLANSARLIAEHPGLLHLRALQAAEQGATVVFGEIPPGTAKIHEPG